MIAWWLAASVAHATPQGAEVPGSVPTVRTLAAAVAEARGLTIPGDLTIEVETPEAVRDHAREELDRPENLAELDCGQTVLEALFEVEPGFDLRAVTEAIQESAVAGYYDSERDRLVLVARGGAFADASLPDADRMTAAHELVHAAQDAAFDLFDLRDREMPTSDLDLALRSLIEGDATWWMLPLSGGVTPEMLQALPATMLAQGLDTMGLGVADDPSNALLASLPAIVRADLVSPYLDGFLFAHAVMQHGGAAALDAAYRDPPLSSEQILHPERYLAAARDVPVLLSPTDAWEVPGWKHTCDDGLGERLVRGLLAEVPGVDAPRAADGWDGDRVRAWRSAEGTAAAAWMIATDRDQDARELFHALSAWLDARTGTTARGRRARVWIGAERTAALTREGSDVFVVTGLPRGRATTLLGAMRDTPRAPLTDLRAIAPRRPPPDAPASP